MPKAVVPHDCLHRRAEIALRVVGEQGAHADSQRSKPGDRPREEASRRWAVVVREDLGKAETGAVVDGDVEMLPADEARSTAAIAVNPMTDPTEAPEFLRIEVQQSAGAPVFIPDDRPRWLEATQPIQPQAALDGHDCGNREPVILRDAHRAPATAPASFNLPAMMPRALIRAAAGPRGAVAQPALSLSLESASPFPYRGPGDAELSSQLRLIRPRQLRSESKLPSTSKGQSCILVGVHRSSGSCR